MTATDARKVRIGLIGAGGIAGAHVAGYRRNPETVEFAAIADPVRDSAEKRRGDDEDVRIYDDYREMIAAGGLDAVDICLPHHLHADAAITASASWARGTRSARPTASTTTSRWRAWAGAPAPRPRAAAS